MAKDKIPGVPADTDTTERNDPKRKQHGEKYGRDTAYNERLGARIDLDNGPADEERALRDVIPKTMGDPRENPEQLPHDPIDLGTRGPKNPHEPTDQSGLNKKNI